VGGRGSVLCLSFEWKSVELMDGESSDDGTGESR